jgi:hypothetical protein
MIIVWSHFSAKKRRETITIINPSHTHTHTYAHTSLGVSSAMHGQTRKSVNSHFFLLRSTLLLFFAIFFPRTFALFFWPRARKRESTKKPLIVYYIMALLATMITGVIICVTEPNLTLLKGAVSPV